MALAQNPPAAERAKRGGATGGSGAVTAAVAVVVGVAVLAALQLQRGLDYWNYSEGVYAFTSRLLLRGDGIYRDVVAAQPPWQFLLGAGVLAIRDSLEALRLALGALQLATALLGAVAVWRLTASRTATVLTAPLGLLTPWAVHEHGSLTPEVVAAPLLLSAALLSTARRSTPVAAVLAAAAVFVKLPFVVALVPIVALSAVPRRAAVWALGALAVQAIAFTVLFGTGLWTDTVIAQAHVAYRGARDAAEVLAQPAWNLAALVVLAGVAVVRRD